MSYHLQRRSHQCRVGRGSGMVPPVRRIQACPRAGPIAPEFDAPMCSLANASGEDSEFFLIVDNPRPTFETSTPGSSADAATPDLQFSRSRRSRTMTSRTPGPHGQARRKCLPNCRARSALEAFVAVTEETGKGYSRRTFLGIAAGAGASAVIGGIGGGLLVAGRDSRMSGSARRADWLAGRVRGRAPGGHRPARGAAAERGHRLVRRRGPIGGRARSGAAGAHRAQPAPRRRVGRPRRAIPSTRPRRAASSEQPQARPI